MLQERLYYRSLMHELSVGRRGCKFHRHNAGVCFMLDSTKDKRAVFVGVEKQSIAPEASHDGLRFRVFLAKIYQLKRMIVRLMLVGAIIGGLVGVADMLVRIPAFTAS